MIKFKFIARNGEETLPIEVSMAYKPGKQTQRARRLAVGELLATLAIERAEVDATGEDLVTVVTDDARWVIAEGGGVGERRGGV